MNDPVNSPNGRRRYGADLDPLVAGALERLTREDAELARRYWQNDPVEDLVGERTNLIDALVLELWEGLVPEATRKEFAVYAVGGYGRREQFPYSDVDLLLVGRKPDRHQDDIRRFLHGLYDLNMTIGHSVRQPGECKTEAARDVTVATALFERRLLTGPVSIDQRLDKILSSSRLWSPAAFYRAKRDEQQARHKQYDNVDYGLEPNLKTSPGGLRDIQTALWILQRQFGTDDPAVLEELGMLSSQERGWLESGRRFLWWVRYGLHLVAGRHEDRLQFEYQRNLSRRLGYIDTDAKLGVERFMQQYYRHVLALREVNDILLQHFDESILRSRERPRIEPINARFHIRNDYIEMCHDQVFAAEPSALLEIFVLMANRRDIAGVRADTIRAIREHLHLIDDDFRCNPQNTRLFIDLLKAPHTLVSQLTRMRRYGVLGRYLPEYGEIIGQMQHDLFHIYTVDAHTMQVIRNMRRFHYRSAEEQYPVAAHCVRNLPKIELLYIAGLYHDIGKGRGGDHSQLGADYVTDFCRHHGLNEDDCDLVRWLVEQHLVMSSTAQRKDIYDPDVIHEFASTVKSEMRLNYLYALTVADINATNPTLWNNWRATLLRTLYSETRKALRRGLESPLDKRTTVRACQDSARERLQAKGLSDADIDRLFLILGDEFVLRHSPRQLAAMALAIHEHDLSSGPLVMVTELRGSVAEEAATEITMYLRDEPNLFAATVAALDQLSLSVHDAVVHTVPGDVCLNTFVVLDADGEAPSSDAGKRAEMTDALATALARPENYPDIVQRRVSRQLRQLTRATTVDIDTLDGAGFSQVTIRASDRPGLLASIGRIFADLGISVQAAKITTLGDRVEDFFYVNNATGEPLVGEEAYLVENALRQRLDRQIHDGG